MKNHDAVMVAFRKSQELLHQIEIEHRGMTIVLFGMIMYGYSYSETVKLWAECHASDPREVSQKLDMVVRASGHGSSAAALLNELYRKEVVNAD